MNNISNFIDKLQPILTCLEASLEEAFLNDTIKTLQFPVLLGTLKLKMNWDDKQVRVNDPILREYIRSHPDWDITRGAHGGIMRAAEKQKKEDLKIAKDKAKAELNAMLDAEVAKKKAAASISASVAEDNTSELPLDKSRSF